jgi:hypothetical protein
LICRQQASCHQDRAEIPASSVVAPQSVVILTVLTAGVFVGLERPLLFWALVLWLGGGALYLWIITLIFLRYTFVHMAPEDLAHWINMGAVAISTLASATLIEHTALSPVVVEIVPFVKGFALFFWAIATLWIPMLLVLGVWWYLICGVPLAYDPPRTSGSSARSASARILRSPGCGGARSRERR